MTMKQWLKSNGFSEEGITYIIAGGDTYAIKEELKANGCKFNPALNWHSPQEFEIDSEGYVFIPFTFDELYVWNTVNKTADLTSSAKDIITERLAPYKKEKKNLLDSAMMDSEWYGNVGERLRKIPAKIVGKKQISSRYGESTLFTFESGKSVFCWFTSSIKDNQVGETILLSGTVKELKTFQNQKQTYLTRCILAPIE